MGQSWEKLNKEKCIGRKYIDKSMFKYGIHIPIEYREGFISNIKGEYVELNGCCDGPGSAGLSLRVSGFIFFRGLPRSEMVGRIHPFSTETHF